MKFYGLPFGVLALLGGLESVAQSILVSFDLSLVTNAATSHQFTDTASGLTMDMSTNDRWEDGGDQDAAIGFVANADPTKEGGILGLGVLEETNDFTMTFRFNKRVRLESYTISGVRTPFDGDERIRLSDGTSTTEESTIAVGDYNFTNRFEVAANTDLTLTSINPTYPDVVNDPTATDQHIIWRHFRVTVIPEPATYVLLFGGAALSLTILRKRP